MNTKQWHVMPAIISTAILSFCGVLIETSMNVTFPELMSLFSVGPAAIQWLTTANLLAVACIVPLSAYLIRNYSERYIFILANSLFLIGMAIDSIAPTLSILLIGRILQGMGTGIALPLLFHIIMSRVEFEKRGLVMGVATMTTSLAPAIGPSYGGIILAYMGWQMIFVTLFPLILLSTFFGLKSIPNRDVLIIEKVNWLAFGVLGIALSTLLISIEKLSVILFIVSMLSFVLFYFFNKKKMLLNLQVFKNTTYLILLLGVLTYQMIPLALSFILPNHLQLVLNLSSVQAGLFMFPGAILAAILYPLSGHILDRLGAFKPLVLGLSLAIIGLAFMTIALMGKSALFLLVSDILVKAGMGVGASNMITSALTKLEKNLEADGNSVLNTLQQFAGAFATAVASQFFAIGQASGQVNGESLGARNGVYFILVFVVITFINILILKNRKAIS
ncbi:MULTISPECIES: MFS transporter [Streptococcus]|uniref:Multidrug resistance protein B n=2 Tax=Streptococcus parauberis TaxID=1348 RepID=A0ABN0ISS6_9STRE|nr:MFS transporter [Streptococcus parauberis]AUT06001.1 Lincomycin resistance protein LmrB [Streptococcus parauberis]EMG25953.1 Multidrug resistance protein B [Streptococcus parauberis KRS-02083]MDT2748931.1 MFS transporter [Streptococcus parauberis]PCH12303.1 putative transport protein HsrA [Streptococcus parauberis]PNY19145.1 putative transport protein HsrA [Streptococcus parauberis]